MGSQKSNLEIAAGELFCLSSGDYSDYGYKGHFIALRAISEAEMRKFEQDAKERMEADQNAAEPEWYDARDLFIAALIASGAVMSLPIREIHIGSYGSVDLT